MHFTLLKRYFTLQEYMFNNRRSTRTRLQNNSATEIEGSALFENLHFKKNTLLFWKFNRFSPNEQSPNQNQVLQRIDK